MLHGGREYTSLELWQSVAVQGKWSGNMALAALTIDARRLWAGDLCFEGPLAFVDLDATREWPEVPTLPRFPVIGIGPREHPFAGHLDAVIELPATVSGLTQQIRANPEAAAVSVQLLRLVPDLTLKDALVAESLAYGLLQGSAEHLAWRDSRQRAEPPAPPGNVAIRRSGASLDITLDRPGEGNAIDRSMRDALREGFAMATLDASIERLRLQANGRTFSLGADLAEFGTSRDPASAHAIRMQTLPAPMIAACASRLEVQVQGACIGAGLEMAAWAHRIVAQSDAWFQLPELAMGILPGAGGCVSLSRRIGRQRTALMLLSGKRISARTALSWGLVDAIVANFAGDDCEADIG